MTIIKNKIGLITFTFICLLFLCYKSLYIVPEGKIVLLSRTNKVLNMIHSSGLHSKMPFLEQTHFIDLRLHQLSDQKVNVLTADKQPLIIHYYLTWHITHPKIYYQQTRNNSIIVKQHLTETINSFLNLISEKNNLVTLVESNQNLLKDLTIKMNAQLQTWGLMVNDIGITALSRPSTVNQRMIEQSRLKLEQLALQQQQIAKTNADLIRHQASTQTSLALAKAKAEAIQIRTEGDVAAASIYNQAFKKNAKFANFFLDLEAYKKALTSKSKNKNFFVMNQNSFTQFPLEKEHV